MLLNRNIQRRRREIGAVRDELKTSLESHRHTLEEMEVCVQGLKNTVSNQSRQIATLRATEVALRLQMKLHQRASAAIFKAKVFKKESATARKLQQQPNRERVKNVDLESQIVREQVRNNALTSDAILLGKLLETELGENSGP